MTSKNEILWSLELSLLLIMNALISKTKKSRKKIGNGMYFGMLYGLKVAFLASTSGVDMKTLLKSDANEPNLISGKRLPDWYAFNGETKILASISLSMIIFMIPVQTLVLLIHRH